MNVPQCGFCQAGQGKCAADFIGVGADLKGQDQQAGKQPPACARGRPGRAMILLAQVHARMVTYFPGSVNPVAWR